MSEPGPGARPGEAPAPAFAGVRLVDAAAVAASVPVGAAVDALETALRGGLDPEADAPRSRAATDHGELLLMPSARGAWSGVKVLSSTPGNPDRGLPLLQGMYLLFAGDDQRPAALLDGTALTVLRTPAVSALAVRHLVPGPADEPVLLTVFGTGPQARGHVAAVAAVREVAEVTLVGRDRGRLEALAAEVAATGTAVRTLGAGDGDAAVAEADVVCCCTSAREPLFDGAMVRDDAVVVAMGSHHPDARETDDALVVRSAVVVESRASTLREGGDVVLPLAEGVLGAEEIVTLAEVVTGRAELPVTGPRLFKGTGMPWEDLVVAVEVYRAAGPR
ncbi:ornithine cyclodeaminase family protein [Georgenia thermotolerans]|uniref:ornithine cyclodeaminase family protein n=1 Tax=Georgenia thermotolerans TaxID=527326 RepID=UPI001B8BB375|nr:ornithine cyclodeaminase family protein [Georgenia thermotolerans]